MAVHIEAPSAPKGRPEEQISEIYRYLIRMSDQVNRGFEEAGGNELTDSEMSVMNSIGGGQVQTLKDMIIQIARQISGNYTPQAASQGEYIPDSQFRQNVRSTTFTLPVNMDGDTDVKTLANILLILKNFEIKEKNWIYAGILRTVEDEPVYGIAIGNGVTEFDGVGTETYIPENTILEITADGITAGTNLIGDLIGNVTGDVTGDLTGDVTGNVTGDVTGDVTGNLTGDVTGNVTGDVTGNLTGDVTGDVTGNLTGDVTGDVTGDLTGKVNNATTEETDLDDITEAGMYYLTFGSLTNEPPTLTAGDWWMRVLEGGEGCRFQIIYTDTKIYTRMQTSGTWGDWYRYDGQQDQV